MFYSATAKNGYKFEAPFDPAAKKTVGIIYKPPVWTGSTVFYYRAEDDYDVVVPTVFKGVYYKVVNPGLSGITEPTWPTTIGSRVVDGTVIWEAVAYNLLPNEETIAESTWAASEAVTLSGSNNTGRATYVTVSDIPEGVLRFTITNHIVKNNGEEDDITLIFKVGNR